MACIRKPLCLVRSSPDPIGLAIKLLCPFARHPLLVFGARQTLAPIEALLKIVPFGLPSTRFLLVLLPSLLEFGLVLEVLDPLFLEIGALLLDLAAGGSLTVGVALADILFLLS